MLINGGVCSPCHDAKHISYIAQQAIAGNQVVYRMAIRNNVLFQWASLNDSEKNYIDMLNDIIPDNAVRIKKDSERVYERLRVQSIRVAARLREKNRSGSKKQRNDILNSWTNISILASDIMTPGEMEVEKKRLEELVKDLIERLENSNVEVEEWRKKHENLGEEKEKLFEELTEEIVKNQDK